MKARKKTKTRLGRPKGKEPAWPTLTLRVSPELLSKINRRYEKEVTEHPGYKITRADTIRALLTEALSEKPRSK